VALKISQVHAVYNGSSKSKLLDICFVDHRLLFLY